MQFSRFCCSTSSTSSFLKRLGLIILLLSLPAYLHACLPTCPMLLSISSPVFVCLPAFRYVCPSMDLSFLNPHPHSVMHSHTYPLTPSCTYPPTHSPIHWHTRSLASLLVNTRSLIYLLTLISLVSFSYLLPSISFLHTQKERTMNQTHVPPETSFLWP